MMHSESNEKINLKILTVARNTSVHDLSVSISKTIEEGSRVQLIAIGANAVNQMTKGAAKARGSLAQIGKDLAWKIFFTDREIKTFNGDGTVEDSVAGEKTEKVSALVFESFLY